MDSNGGANGFEIAIVGMAGRFPKAKNISQFWHNLMNGVDCVSEFSREELIAAGEPSDLISYPNYVPARAVLDDPDLFDAEFFGVTSREAVVMDPQPRILLECAWEALEDSGCLPESSQGPIGVFAGASSNWYILNVWENPFYVDTLGDTVISIGNDKDYLASYLSYKLDLRGPAVNVQSTCSTSLLAVHLACQSLLAGECYMALAGGVSVRVQQQSGYLYYEGGTGAPDGRTRAFDADADGTVGGSGVGLVALKRLDDALRDRDCIHAIILGSAANNDGALKVGYTAPSVEGQSEVIQRALALAGVSAETVTYVEAHGTGTALGDPIEVKALTNAFRNSAHKIGYCGIGSVKSNIGHLDSAAGIAGLIKAVLMIREGKLVPTLHYRRPNPHLDLDSSPFYVNTDLSDWQPAIGPRRAGVSSFGLGGTNVHLVLEQPPVPSRSKLRKPPFLLTASARTQKSLTAGMQRLADYLTHNSDIDIAQFAYTLQVGRKAFNHRWSSVCSTREEAIEKLLDGIPDAETSVQTTARPRLSFLFPGLGCQQPGMATELYDTEPAFRNAVDECCTILEPMLNLDLRKLLVMNGHAAPELSPERIHEGWIGQPAVFTFEYALATFLLSWGLRPSAMVGHSLGEYVVACLAGVLSLRDALMLVAKRARMMDMTLPGGMLSVPLGEAETRSLLTGDLAIALVNSGENCVVAGSVPALENFENGLLARGITARRIQVGHAYHSPAMDPVLEPFARIVSQVQLHAPRIPYLSNVTGTWINEGQACSPQYWAEHLRETVRFGDCLNQLFSAEQNVVLEIAPSQVLTTMVKQACPHENTIVLSSLPSNHDPTPRREHLLQVIGRLWETGIEVAWPSMYEGSEPGRIPLPTYAWDQQRYWVDGKGQSSHFRSQSPQAELHVEQISNDDLKSKAQAEFEPDTGSQTERTIAAIWKNMLGVTRVRANDNFFALGGDSLLALQLTAKLSRTFGLNLSLHTVLEAKTLTRLAGKIESESSPNDVGVVEATDPLIVEIEPGKAESPVFLLHAVGGSVFSYAPLCERLKDGYMLIGVQPEGFDGTTPLLTTVEEMAQRYILAMKSVQPSGPYYLVGASFGGTLAYEMARRLDTNGEKVAFLAMIDTPGPGLNMDPIDSYEDVIMEVFGRHIAIDRQRLEGLNLRQQIEYVAGESAMSDKQLPEIDFDTAERRIRIWKTNYDAMLNYVPLPYGGRGVFYRAKEQPDGARPERDWIELLTGGVEIQIVPGDHQTMMETPHVAVLAEHLKQAIRVARQLHSAAGAATAG